MRKGQPRRRKTLFTARSWTSIRRSTRHETLFILLETEGEKSQVGKSLGFVAMGLDRNVKDLEKLFAQLHKAARGRAQS